MRVEAFGRAEAQITGHQRFWFLKLQVIERRPDLAGDLQHVPIAICRNKTGAGYGAFDDGVGGDGGAVHDVGHITGASHHLSFKMLIGSLDETDRRILRRGGDFADAQLTRLFVEQGSVGEGAADVDSESIRHLGIYEPPRRRVVSASFTAQAIGSITTP